jgi:hypothetical protein
MSSARQTTVNFHPACLSRPGVKARPWRVLACPALVLALGAAEPPASLQAPAAPHIGSPPPCVSVDIGGATTRDLSCVSTALDQAAQRAQAAVKQGQTDLQVPDAASPSLTTGGASVAGSSERLGGNLRGATQIPKRPVPPPVPTPPFSRQP